MSVPLALHGDVDVVGMREIARVDDGCFVRVRAPQPDVALGLGPVDDGCELEAVLSSSGLVVRVVDLERRTEQHLYPYAPPKPQSRASAILQKTRCPLRT